VVLYKEPKGCLLKNSPKAMMNEQEALTLEKTRKNIKLVHDVAYGRNLASI
jgi:hypothetical protein